MSLSPVHLLKPRIETIDSAVCAFRAGDFHRALGALHGHTSVSAALLRSRCLLRVGQYNESIREVEKLEFDLLTASDTAEALSLMVLSELQRGTIDGVEPMATLARVKAYEAGYVEIEAEVEYAWAVYFLALRQLDDARQALLRIIGLSEDVGSSAKTKALTLNLHDLKARAYDVLGLIEGRANRYEAKASLIIAGLDELVKTDSPDRYLEAVLLANLANLSVDICIPGVHEYIRIRLEGMHFTESIAQFEFQIYRAVGLGYAMQGNHIGALRSLRHSADIAPDLTSRIKAIVDRSILAHELGEMTFANEESEYALRLSKQIDWKAQSGPMEIFALLLLSNGLAKRNASEARRLLDLYQNCKRRLPSYHNSVGDAGLSAREMHTDALISRVEGDVNRAIRLNRDAFESFRSIGYAWRAADVAIELYEMTCESEYLDFAVQYADMIPHSHFARRVTALRVASTVTA